MTSSYSVKPRAATDLDEYADYLSQEAGLEVAIQFLNSAQVTFALLADYPNMGWPARLKHPELKRLRVFRVTTFENMLILYRPLANGVEILRVVHGARNLQALFRRRHEIQ